MRELRQSTTQTELIGPYLDKDDGVTEETALTPATEISKDGGAFAAGPTGGTHDSEGWYPVAFTTTHTNTLGSLMLKSQDAATHLSVWEPFMVVTANYYDSKYGTDVRDASVTQWLGTAVATPGTAGVPSVDVLRWDTTLVATPTVAGVPEVDLTHMEGGTQTVTDLKDFADAGYDPITNKVQGVVLVDTTTAVAAGGITAATFAAGAIDAAALATDAVNEIADGTLDRANAIETGLTLRQAQRLIAAASAGKLSGAATTTVIIREAVNDSKARITATVDADGNRSAITWDVT